MRINDTIKPVILGLMGPRVLPEELRFFTESNPFGFILFQRNCENPDQLVHLCTELRNSVGRDDAPILIDQEGGRVQRLRGPNWREAPPVGKIGALWSVDESKAEQAAFLHAQMIGIQLRTNGITVNCAPCLDLAVPGAHEVIGDRSYGSDPRVIQVLGQAACRGFGAAGVHSIVKHLPGHGRAMVDSHLSLPVLDADLDTLGRTDFEAFRSVPENTWGMTAHLLIPDIDPDQCITFSSEGISGVIRREIGFNGLLMSDDLSMNALSGSLESRAERALAAGCDIALHCNGKMHEMRDVCHAASHLSDETKRRILDTPVLEESSESLDTVETAFTELVDSTAQSG